MKYKLGDKKIHPYSGEAEGYSIVVAIFNEQTEEYDTLKDFDLDGDLEEFLEGGTDDAVIVYVERDGYGDFLGKDEIEDAYSERDGEVLPSDFISEAEFYKRKEVGDKIVALLKENNIDTSDLIVSDGKVYQGYSECASYIQGTLAWCSSSMSC